MTEPPVSVCPNCGAKPRRLISGGAGFLFKGSGFYLTDYRSKDYRDKAKAEKSDAAVAKSDSGTSKGPTGSSSGSSSGKTSTSPGTSTSPKSD